MPDTVHQGSMLLGSTHLESEHVPPAFRQVLDTLCRVAGFLASTIALGPLDAALSAPTGTNTDGDTQKTLDILADELFAEALSTSSVCFYASEERERIETLDPSGRFAMAIDPLDGSSNIDANVSIGTIFSIYDALESAERSFLRPASEQIASGYFIYGPQCALIVTFGAGVLHFVLDPRERRFRLVADRLTLPAAATEFAINASNYRRWPKPVRSYIDDCMAGEDGPTGQDFNMRWIASLVAETHRIISRGGIFLYPADSRPAYRQGRLRLLYECAPIAFLIEQAGGGATDGCDRILNKATVELHQRTPFVFGTADMVERVVIYHDLPEHEVSALFGTRGLFRA